MALLGCLSYSKGGSRSHTHRAQVSLYEAHDSAMFCYVLKCYILACFDHPLTIKLFIQSASPEVQARTSSTAMQSSNSHNFRRINQKN